MAITIGQQLGSYEIAVLLGKGGMGEVYRARDPKLKRDVAIKILPDEFSLVQPSFQSHAVFSPDGRWLAYMSNELVRFGPQIFVQPYPGSGAKYQITTDGGGEPLWPPDGKQLFYYWNSKLIAIDVQTEPSVSFGKPSPLPITGALQQTGLPRNYDITPDGKQFIIVLAASQGQNNQPATPQINVVLNWVEELKQRVPVH